MGEGSDTSDKRPQVRLFTDGACIDNPGPGGWAYILQHEQSGRSKEDSDGDYATTNNRMEIMAVMRGLAALKLPSRVTLFSDSKYVINGITDWMPKWKRFGWRRTVNAKSHIKNADLWQRLDKLLQGHEVTTEWVRGHDGHRENERCDQLAEAAAAKFAALPPPAELPTQKFMEDHSLFESDTDQDPEE